MLMVTVWDPHLGTMVGFWCSKRNSDSIPLSLYMQDFTIEVLHPWDTERICIIQRFCKNKECGQLGAALTIVFFTIKTLESFHKFRVLKGSFKITLQSRCGVAVVVAHMMLDSNCFWRCLGFVLHDRGHLSVWDGFKEKWFYL